MFKSLALCSLLLSLTCNVAWADGKADKIRRLIEVNGALNVVDEVIQRQGGVVAEAFRARHPKAGEAAVAAYVSEFAAELRRRRTQFVDIIVPGYADSFSEAEIDELLAFFTSPVGRKLQATSGRILAAARAAGRQWGAEHGPEVARTALAQVKAAGYEVD